MDETRLLEIAEQFFHKKMDKGARQLIHAWATDSDFDSWRCATDLLDYHGWERRGNRVPLNDAIRGRDKIVES